MLKFVTLEEIAASCDGVGLDHQRSALRMHCTSVREPRRPTHPSALARPSTSAASAAAERRTAGGNDEATSVAQEEEEGERCGLLVAAVVQSWPGELADAGEEQKCTSAPRKRSEHMHRVLK
jgi:hypothetical protein